jgi:hypothetical protein
MDSVAGYLAVQDHLSRVRGGWIIYTRQGGRPRRFGATSIQAVATSGSRLRPRHRGRSTRSCGSAQPSVRPVCRRRRPYSGEGWIMSSTKLMPLIRRRERSARWPYLLYLYELPISSSHRYLLSRLSYLPLLCVLSFDQLASSSASDQQSGLHCHRCFRRNHLGHFPQFVRRRRGRKNELAIEICSVHICESSI